MLGIFSLKDNNINEIYLTLKNNMKKQKINCPNIYRFDCIKENYVNEYVINEYVINEVKVISGAGMNKWMSFNKNNIFMD